MCTWFSRDNERCTVATRLARVATVQSVRIQAQLRVCNGSKVYVMFQPVTEETVCKILQSLNSNKATGLDKVPPRFLKDGAKFITALLTSIFLSLSLSLSISLPLVMWRYLRCCDFYDFSPSFPIGRQL